MEFFKVVCGRITQLFHTCENKLSDMMMNILLHNEISPIGSQHWVCVVMVRVIHHLSLFVCLFNIFITE